MRKVNFVKTSTPQSSQVETNHVFVGSAKFSQLIISFRQSGKLFKCREVELSQDKK